MFVTLFCCIHRACSVPNHFVQPLCCETALVISSRKIKGICKRRIKLHPTPDKTLYLSAVDYHHNLPINPYASCLKLNDTEAFADQQKDNHCAKGHTLEFDGFHFFYLAPTLPDTFECIKLWQGREPTITKQKKNPAIIGDNRGLKMEPAVRVVGGLAFLSGGAEKVSAGFG